ncbi:9843_t:CDS:2, partial [Scutellospora calospora]
ICNYVLVGIWIINETLSVKNKKSGLRPLAQKLQTVTLAIKNHLICLKDQLTRLKDLFKDDVENSDTILLCIKSEPHVEFCNDEENIPFIKVILDKIKTNWKNSILNLIKEIESKIESI